MISIHVDESYALDLLSIYEVKLNNSNPNQKAANQCAFNLLLADLRQCWGDKIDDILFSEEYKKLIDVNTKIFHLIERVRSQTEDSIGKQIDNLNLERFNYKHILQSRFFENSLLLETKTQME